VDTEDSATDAGTSVVDDNRSKSLNAQAPSFVPTFAAFSSPSPLSGSDPISIPDSPTESTADEPAVEDTTPQASRPSPISLATSQSPESSAALEPNKERQGVLEQQETTEQEEDDVNSRKPTVSTSILSPLPPSRSPSTTSTYSPSILRNLIAQSCQSGDLPRLQLLFAQNPESDELFTLANSINPATGFAPIHYAAKKGHLEVVKWLVEDGGAMHGLEDGDGETALHKACLSGRTEIVEYLLGVDGVEMEGTDNDGWTVSFRPRITFRTPGT
jgi:hypothetical protein